MNGPRVSIVIPCFNAERWVAQAIQSALDQSHPRVEVIVIDDGSTDASLVEIQKFGDRIRCVAGVNRGACAARNHGLRLAQGDYVKFLDADDFLYADAVARQVEFASGLSERQIGYGRHDEIRRNGRVVRRRRVARTRVDPIADLILHNIATSLSLYPADALREVDGFDERLRFRQEWNLNLRLALAGRQFVFYDKPVFCQRLHAASCRISNREYIPERELENLSVTRELLAPLDRQSIEDAWAAYLWQTGRNFLKAGERQAATEFFAMAVQTSRSGYKRHFPLTYNLAVALLGPYFVERAGAASLEFRRHRRAVLSYALSRSAPGAADAA